MRFITILSSLLLTISIFNPLAAEEIDAAEKCDIAYDVCIEKCEKAEDGSETCQKTCEDTYEQCLAEQNK